MIKDFLQKRKKDIFFAILLLGLSVFCLRQFFPKGIFYAHDTKSHIIRVDKFSQELRNGQFPVRMSSDLALGRSYPLFNYTYVLPYFFGAILNLFGFSLVTSIKLLIFLTSLISIQCFYIFLRIRYSRLTSFLGASLYLLIPFRFLTTFVTGQLGVIFAFFWIPLILYFLEKTIRESKKKYFILLAFSYVGLILSHLISSIILTPAFIFYFFIIQESVDFKKLKKYFFTVLLALSLSIFYLLPAIFEMKYVKAGQLEIVHFSDHYISLKQLFYSNWGYWYSILGFNDQISFQLGLAQWLILLLAFIYVLINYFFKKFSKKIFKNTQIKKIIKLILLIFIFLFLMLPQSHLFWETFSYFTTVQHPWRLLMVPMFLIPILVATIIESIRNKFFANLITLLILFTALYTNRNYQRPMETAIRHDDAYYKEDRQEFYGSGDVAWEFLPKWVPEQPKTFPEEVLDSNLLSIPIESQKKLSLDQTWDLNLVEDQEITLNVFYFPSWKVELDGETAEIYPNADGLTSISLPTGEHRLRLYLANTNLAMISNLVSLLALIASILLLII